MTQHVSRAHRRLALVGGVAVASALALTACSPSTGTGGNESDNQYGFTAAEQDPSSAITVWVDSSREPLAQAFEKANPDVKQTLTIGRDNSALKANLTAFVTAYNAINTTLKSATAYNSTTNTASALTGDAMVRGLQQQLRTQLSSNVNDLKDLGLTIAADGTLSLDAAKLDTALSKNPEAANKLFGADGALAKPMTELMKSSLDTTSGTITQRQATLNKQIKALEKQLDGLDKSMEKVSDRYTKQFTAMEKMVSQMQSASGSLIDQLG